MTTWQDWLQLGDDIEAARELASDDPAFAEEAEVLAARARGRPSERLRRLLVPRDATDAKDALLEIKSGEGGEESALFAGDLLRMYTRYAETARVERRGPRRHRVRPRRLQVRHRGRQGAGGPSSPARRRTRC